MSAAAPVRVIDALNGLLDAERHNIIRFMGEGSPYLGRATAEVRRPLQEMVEANARHVRSLGDLIIALGGIPATMSPVVSEEQYLAFLSLKFLLPKLVHSEQLIITRYENVLASLPDAPANVTSLLEAHLAEHRNQVTILEKAAAEVLARSR